MIRPAVDYDALKSQARALKAQGVTYADIGRALGVYDSTVRRWLDPDQRAAHRAYCRAQNRAKRRAR